MEAIQTSIDREVGKEDVVYLHNGILHSHKKNEIMPFAATQVDLEIIIWHEVSETDRQTSYDTVYMWNLGNYTNECITEIDSQT